MEHLDLMKENNMDVASEFLDMASRLVEIKSYELLPKYEEGEKLKEELQGQLLEYQECRKAAKKLGEIVSFDNYCRNQIKMKCDTKYKRSHDPSILVAAYMAAVGRGKKIFRRLMKLFRLLSDERLFRFHREL